MKKLFYLILLLMFPAIVSAEVKHTRSLAEPMLFSPVVLDIAFTNYEQDVNCGGLKYWGVQAIEHKTGNRFFGNPRFVNSAVLAQKFTFDLPMGNIEELTFICSDDGVNEAFQFGSIENDLTGDQVIFSAPPTPVTDETIKNLDNTKELPSPVSPDDENNNVPVIAILSIPSPLVVTDDANKVAYEYTVWNVGGSHAQSLTDVEVTDDGCRPITFLTGDLNSDGKLNEGEKWEYGCTTTLSETTTNTATVIAYDDDIGHKAATASTTTTVVVVPEQGLENTTTAPDTEFPDGTPPPPDTVPPTSEPQPDATPPPDTVLFPETGFIPIVKNNPSYIAALVGLLFLLIALFIAAHNKYKHRHKHKIMSGQGKNQ